MRQLGESVSTERGEDEEAEGRDQNVQDPHPDRDVELARRAVPADVHHGKEIQRERGDGTLRVSDRREIIQVGAALSRRADQFLANHPDKVEAVKRLFTLRLAHVPRQGEPVRARWEQDATNPADRAVDAE